jgi:uncharacterized GH25 family protein
MHRRLGLLALCLGMLAAHHAAAEEIQIGGIVQLPGGAPLAEIEVLLFPLLDPLNEARTVMDPAPPEPVARALTNAKGRFRLVAPHAGLWSVRVAAAGFVPEEAVLQPLIEEVELPPLELSSDVGMTVRAVDEQVRPVAGARVFLRSEGSRFFFQRSTWSPPLRSGQTDDDGTVQLPRGERERVTLSLSAAGFTHRELRGLPGTAATVTLRRGVSRVVEVRASDGKPESGVLLALGARPHPIGWTDADGRITAQVDRSQPAALSLLAADARRLDGRLSVGAGPEQKPRRLVLPERRFVSGRLIDGLSRRPIEGGLVWDRASPMEAAVTDRAGGFVLGGPALARLQITAGAPGYMNTDSHEFQLVDDGRAGPTLALAPAAAVQGKIVDADGRAVEGAEARLQVKRNPGMMRIEIGGPPALPRTLSDASGAFRIGQIDPEKSYTLEVQAEGFAPAELTVSELEPYRTKSGLRIELSRGQGLRGTVVDGEGLPLRDATVKLQPASSGHGMRMLRIAEGGDAASAVETASGSDGRFELSGLPAGKFDLGVTRSGFAKRSVPAVEIEEGSEPVDLGEIALQRGERVQGFVLDHEGQPVEGAEIYVGESGPMMVVMSGAGAPTEEADASTDPSGWFVVEDLARGSRYSLSVRRTGFVEASVSSVDVPRSEPVEVTLRPASRVSGMVLDPEGEPIPGAQVNLSRTRTMEMGGNVMRMMMRVDESTDSEGRFLFEDQEPGEISLGATASGYQEAKLDNLEIPKGEDLEGVELPLVAGAIVQGRVSAPDGRPAIGASVRVVPESGGMMMMPGGAPSDGSGNYRLEGLAPGSASIEATHPDYPRAVKDLEVREGINSLDLAFEGGHEVSGAISDEAGNPVADAMARLVPVGRSWGGPEARSANDGSFTMPGVQDGDYRLWAEAEGYASSPGDVAVSVAGDPVSGLVVRLKAGATIIGTIRGLEPERFSGVTVQAEGGGFGGFGGAAVDYEGNYRLEHLTPGSYTVVASLEGSGRQAQSKAVLEPGATELRVDLEFGRGLTLSGQAVQAGQPIVGATVFAEGIDVSHTGWSQTDHQGRFSLDGLESGGYDVHVRNWQTGLAYNERVELATSREIVLEIPTARVGGQILDASDRQPLAGVSVTLTSAEQQDAARLPTHAATTDLNGRFELASVADGSWRLSASKQGYAAIAETVTVQYEKTVEDLRLSMDATEGLTLQTRLPSGAPPGEVRVAVLDASGSAVVSGIYATGENGRVRLSSVPPGSWEVIVSAAGAATSSLRAEAPGATVPVALRPATGLRVSVPELSDADVVAMVSLRDQDNRPFRSLSWNGGPRSEWRLSGGSIEFASLPPGTWQVKVAAADGRSWQDSSATAPGTIAELTLN